MAKIGRPTKYRPEYCQEIIDFMAEGYSKEAFAGEIDVYVDAIYRWIKKYKAFSKAVKKAEAKCRLHWEELGHDMVVAGQGNATVWIFNMKNRFNWRDRSEDEETDKTVTFKIVLDVNDKDNKVQSNVPISAKANRGTTKAL